MTKNLFSNRTPFEKCYLVENVKQLSFIPGNRNLRIAHVKNIFKAAIQLIKGKYSTKEFKEGALKISDEEYMEASKKAAALCLISVKLNTKVVFRRDVVVVFYCVWDKIPNTQTYVKRLSLFKMPLTESRKEWERAYEDLLR